MSAKNFTYTLKIDAEVKDLVAKTKLVKDNMSSITAAGAPEIEKAFGAIEKALTKLQEKASVPITSAATFGSLNKDVASITVALNSLNEALKSLKDGTETEKLNLLPPETKQQIEGIIEALNTFAVAEEKASEKTSDLVAIEKELAAAKKDVQKAEGRVAEKKALVDTQKEAVDTAHAEADAIKAKLDALKKFQETSKAYEAVDGDKRKAGGGKSELKGKNLPADRRAAAAAMPDLDLGNEAAVASAIDQLAKQYNEANKAVTDAENIQRKYNNQLNEANNTTTVAKAKVEGLEQQMSTLNSAFEKTKAEKTQTAFNNLRNAAEKLGVKVADIPTEYTAENFAELEKRCQSLRTNGLEQAAAACDQAQAEIQELGEVTVKTGEKLNDSETEFGQLSDRAAQSRAFADRIKDFVGLAGAAKIMGRAFRDAFSTIKELDAAMTEMAVVTDTDISGYWDRLPEYTARANEMGLAIKDVYQADTLYYQQGLKTEQVIALSAQTMKMARVAGLDTAEATDRMTAALRGFNMELNETNAQKIADVYSELAAITASDVDEISSAMTKTASIAASAGMEFETTAAFLSQIIETTRESAETAGTAMKTVIARFQELKKDPSEIGEVDGEIVDANKIETALRSVGVALRDSSGQFRDLDDVFLELAQKWDGLDTNTQRYIATIAAGSRQQSRFIAMMSDYSRTAELVEAANTSAGASNEQFEKTMDSLSAKLNKLKVAWDAFTMDLMDSDLLKMGVDLLTEMLTAVNNFTNAFGDFSGTAKIGLLVAALYLGDKAINVFRKSIDEGSTAFQALGAVGRSAVTSATTAINKMNHAMSDSNLQMQKLAQSLKLATGKKFTQNTNAYKEALAKSSAATKDATAKENAYNIAMFSSRTTTEQVNKARLQSVAADKAKTAADAELIAAENALAATLGLTTTQQAAANGMSALGISYDQAAILASAGYTAATLQEAAAAQGLTAAEYAEKLVKDANTKSTGLAAIASFILASAHTLQKEGLKGLIASWWAQLTAKFADIAATWQQVAANVALQASMWYILAVILLIVAAIAALVLIVWGLIEAFKAIEANSPEGKLKTAEDAANKAADAADRAAESYKTLSDAFDSLDDKYKGLEEMTKGTREWRDAVREINSEVMDLVDQYPELSDLVTNEDGVLSIDLDSAEAQAVLDKYEQNATYADSASVGAQLAVHQAQDVVDRKNLSDSATVESEAGRVAGHIGGVLAGALLGGGVFTSGAISAQVEKKYAEDSQNTDALAQALAEGLIVEGRDGWEITEGSEEALAELGLAGDKAVELAETLGDGAEELKEYGKTIAARNAQEEALKEALAASAASAVDATKYTAEEMQQISVAADSGYTDIFLDNASADLEKKLGDMGDEERTNFFTDKAKQIYGESAKADKNGNVTYLDEEGNEQTVSADMFKEQVAAADATENMTKALEKLPEALESAGKKLEKASEGAGKALSKLYQGKDGSAMSREDTEALAKLGDKELQQTWDKLSSSEKEAFGSFENFKDNIQESVEIQEKAFAKIDEQLSSVGIDPASLSGALTSAAAQGLTDNILNIVTASGPAAGKQFIDSFNQITAGLSDEGVNKFASMVNSIDWTDADAWDGLEEQILEMGSSLGLTEAELEKFIAEAKQAANAIKEIDLNAVVDTMKEMNSIIGSIQSGEQNRGFSEEDYQKIIELNPDLSADFVMTDDGYEYIGTSMEKLAEALKQNTEAQFEEGKRQLEAKIQMAEASENIIETGVIYEDTEAKQHNKQVEMWANILYNMERIFIGEDKAKANKQKYLDDNLEEETRTLEFDERSKWDEGESKAYLKALVAEYQKQGVDLASLGIAGLGSQTTGATIDNMSEEQVSVILDAISENVANKDKNTKTLTEAGKNATMLSMLTNSLEENIALRRSGTDEERAVAHQAIGVQARKMGVGDDVINAYYNAIARGAPERVLQDLEEEMLTMSSIQQTIDENAARIETTYDALYNASAAVNANLRKREALEREYQNLALQENVTAKEYADLQKQQLDNLDEELELLKAQRDLARQDLSTTWTQGNEEWQKYVDIDEETGQISVDSSYSTTDWGKNDAAREAFEEWVAELQDNVDSVQDMENALDDNTDAQKAIIKQGRDSTSQLFTKVQEALLNKRQKEIDALSAINDSINDAQSALLDSMQQQIDEARQARDNEKTESQIADAEARLAYLRMDTSGANAMEIATLEKSIGEQKEAYQDSLVDQALNNIQEANEQAAQQREQQILIAEQQLKAYASSSEIWSDVQRLITTSNEQMNNGIPAMDTAVGQLLAEDAKLNTMNPFEREDWQTDFKSMMGNVNFYYANKNNNTEDPENAGFEVKDTLPKTSEPPKTPEPTIVEVEISGAPASSSDLLENGTRQKSHIMVRAYETGGLADFTGPAWLDGTKSHPELVLNQRDTANFIQLKDILAHVLDRTGSTTNNTSSGDNYYEIEINVDSIEGDYDVEQMADKIRDMIYRDATYRNVNAVNQKK